MTVTNYQRVEHGLQNLTVATLARIASALGVKIGAFFTKPRSKRPPPGRPKRRRRR